VEWIALGTQPVVAALRVDEAARPASEDVAFRILAAAGEHPHCTIINELRATPRAAFAERFQQLLAE
jgi:hypothetical protein